MLPKLRRKIQTPKEEAQDKTPEHLPYGRQVIEPDDILTVIEALKSPFLTTGPYVDAFEQALGDYVDADHTVVCSNGTAALHLAALALNLGPGDQVIVPAITFVATANAARYVSADVIFADVDPDTGLMRPQDLAHAIDRADPARLKAVFNVHLTGQCGDVIAMKSLCDKHGLKLVDDACHALGTIYQDHDGNDHTIGSCAHCDMTVFSFHPVKAIAMGEGGAITTKNPELAGNLKRLRNHGLTRDPESYTETDLAWESQDNKAPNPWYYELQELGLNYRASDLHCALGLSQLKKLNRFVETRQSLVAHYDRLLKPLAPRIRPINKHANPKVGWHLYVALFDFNAIGKSRAEFMRLLNKRQVGTQVHYIPVHRQPYYRNLYGDQNLPGAEAYYQSCLSLPLAADMSTEDVDRVVDVVTNLIT